MQKPKSKIFGIDKNVFLLGFVSLFTDVSSEMIFSVFSVFFTVILGASVVLLGVIEGLADFAASSMDYVSGFISDMTGRRKRFAFFGYGFSTLAKSMLLFANSVELAAAFRVIERLGKSFRGPPRDAWIASLTDKSNRGISFGVHKALDKLGAVLGPLVAYWILNTFGQSMSSFKLLFWIALAPAIVAVVFIALLKDKKAKPARKKNIFKSYKKMGKGFMHYFYAAGLFSLAYFSFGFLLLKAYVIGFQIKDVVLLYALFNVAFVISSILVGKLGDNIGRRKIISLEYIIYAIMCIGFVLAVSKIHIILLFIAFGIFYSIDEGQSKAYIIDLEKDRRATAIGIYNFATGVIYLPASVIAGYLWTLNPSYAFIFAGVISLLALGLFASRKIGK